METEGQSGREITMVTLDLKETRLEISQFYKGMVMEATGNLVDVKLFRGNELRDYLETKNFYKNPGRFDLFVYEKGRTKREEALLVEKAIRFGEVKIFADNFLTVEPDKKLDGFEFFYHDKEYDETRKFDIRQFGADFVQGKPQEEDTLVCRIGNLVIGDKIKHYAYLSVLDMIREPYLADREENRFKRWKNFCQRMNED